VIAATGVATGEAAGLATEAGCLPEEQILASVRQRNCGVAIVAPSGCPQNDALIARAVARLEQQGCEVHNYYDPACKHMRFGGTDGARRMQLHAAARDADVEVVLALRGSYGLSRILPEIDYKMCADSGKLFVGYSDFNAFSLALLAQTGAASFAGPMICDDWSGETLDAFTLQNFWECAGNTRHAICVEAADNPSVEVDGTLWGGNLTMLTHLLGSPYFPAIEGGILFLEDIAEHPFRVERMLLQLHHAGVLDKQQAIILGDFSGYRLGQFENGYNFQAMLAFIRSQLRTPVLTGLPFGHIRRRVTLPIGGYAQLRSRQGAFSLAMAGYPHLR